MIDDRVFVGRYGFVYLPSDVCPFVSQTQAECVLLRVMLSVRAASVHLQ